MIEKLRRRFIRISLIALAAAMLIVTGAINLMNWFNVRSELYETLSALSEPREPMNISAYANEFGKNRHKMNLINESAYFSGQYTEEKGPVVRMNASMSDMLTREDASDLIRRAVSSGKTDGFIDEYLFMVRNGRDGEPMYFLLNAETRLNAVRRLLVFSGIACLCGITLAMVAVMLASRRAVAPIIKNEKQQKEFITNISHELKTPLTVISANMDVLSLDLPENQWIRSTRKQTSAMRKMVDEMVYLARMEENTAPLEKREINLRNLMEETAEPFAAMAEFRGKGFEMKLEDDLTVQADVQAVERLITILCDNAVKYAQDGSVIRLSLYSEGKNAVIETCNTPVSPMTKEQCEHLFDRFYRADESRSRKEGTNSYGIGLAIALAVAEKHDGSVSAFVDEEGQVHIRCVLPRQ